MTRCSLCRMEAPYHPVLCWIGSVEKALGDLQPTQYCNNAWCESRTTHYYITKKGDPMFLCQECADAFRLGQRNPKAAVRTVGGQDEL